MRNLQALKTVACALATLSLAGCGSSSHTAPTVTITPKNAAVVVTTQTQQFAATVTGGSQTVVWSVDGVVGGSAATGTISTTGLYTPPSVAGRHLVSATTTAAAGSSSDAQKIASATVAVTDLL